MAEYEKMYAVLCCAIDDADALDMLEKVPDAQNTAELLQAALLKAENMFVESSSSQ